MSTATICSVGQLTRELSFKEFQNQFCISYQKLPILYTHTFKIKQTLICCYSSTLCSATTPYTNLKLFFCYRKIEEKRKLRRALFIICHNNYDFHDTGNYHFGEKAANRFANKTTATQSHENKKNA